MSHFRPFLTRSVSQSEVGTPQPDDAGDFEWEDRRIPADGELRFEVDFGQTLRLRVRISRDRLFLKHDAAEVGPGSA